MANKHNLNGMRARRVTADIITYIFLSIMCIVWLMPFFWVIMQSFRDGKGASTLQREHHRGNAALDPAVATRQG